MLSGGEPFKRSLVALILVISHPPGLVLCCSVFVSRGNQITALYMLYCAWLNMTGERTTTLCLRIIYQPEVNYVDRLNPPLLLHRSLIQHTN